MAHLRALPPTGANRVAVRSSNRWPASGNTHKSSFFLFAIGISLVVLAGRASATDYYVDSLAANGDSTAGTSTTSPWQTINKVVSQEAAGVFKPGDIFIFEPVMPGISRN
jgi:hypothetical protein